MPVAPSHALLALNALIGELDKLDANRRRIDAVDTEVSPRVARARSEAMERVALARREAMERLAAADRLDLFEAATEALAAACARRDIPQPARAAAHSAMIGLIASDLLPQGTFHAVYDDWEAAVGGHADSPAILHGEEVLFHIE